MDRVQRDAPGLLRTHRGHPGAHGEGDAAEVGRQPAQTAAATAPRFPEKKRSREK